MSQIDWTLSILFMILPILLLGLVIVMVVIDLRDKNRTYINKETLEIFKVYKLKDKVKIKKHEFDYVVLNVKDNDNNHFVSKDFLDKNYIKVMK